MNATATRIANFVREEKLLTGLLAGFAVLVIAALALAAILGVKEGPAPEPGSISYLCNGVPTELPCSISGWPNATQIIVIN